MIFAINPFAPGSNSMRHAQFTIPGLEGVEGVVYWFGAGGGGSAGDASGSLSEAVTASGAASAAAVILAHNHPSGVAEPSQADERITRRLKAALELVDIRLLDHLVVGDGRVVSLASRGLL